VLLDLVVPDPKRIGDIAAVRARKLALSRALDALDFDPEDARPSVLAVAPDAEEPAGRERRVG